MLGVDFGLWCTVTNTKEYEIRVLSALEMSTLLYGPGNLTCCRLGAVTRKAWSWGPVLRNPETRHFESERLYMKATGSAPECVHSRERHTIITFVLINQDSGLFDINLISVLELFRTSKITKFRENPGWEFCNEYPILFPIFIDRFFFLNGKFGRRNLLRELAPPPPTKKFF